MSDESTNGRWAKSEKDWSKAAEARQFGGKVGYYRRRADLTQAKAAQQAQGISIHTWRALERGHTNPLATYQKALKRLQAIASAVSCTLEELTNCD